MEAALYDVEKKGWYVFCLGEKLKTPDGQLAPNGFNSSSNDLNQIREWWTKSPNANIGVDLGRSNLTVLDFDKGQPPAELGLPETLWITTSRGTHVYFTGVSKQQNMYFNGVHLGEIKSAGGYVLAPFSIHPDGPIYSVAKRAAIAPLPEGLIDRLRPTERKPSPTMKGDKIPRGQHDIELTRIAGKLRQVGMEEEAICSAITEVCEKRCENYDADYQEMTRKISHSVCNYPIRNTDLALNQSSPAAEAKAVFDAQAVEATKRLDDWLSESEKEMEPEAVVESCALLSNAKYEHRRTDIAKKMKWRAGLLDDERKKLMPKEKEKMEGEQVVVVETEPWTEPVILSDVLNEIEKTLNRYIHFRHPEDAITAALWTAQTWTVDFQGKFPYLGARSPIPECGKTTLLTIINWLVRRAVMGSSLTTASVFRVMHIYKPTLIIDELDTVLEKDPEFFGILNSGHSREAGKVFRVLGDDHDLRMFITYGAKAYGMIGDPPAAFATRTLPITLDPKCVEDNLEDFPDDDHDREELKAGLNVLARKLCRWVQDNEGDIKTRKPNTKGLISRRRDNWRPLLVVAELAGQGWVEKAHLAAGLKDQSERDSEGKLFLQDVRNIFHTQQAEQMSPGGLLADLRLQTYNGWESCGRRGEGLNNRRVADLFEKFGIKSVKVWNKQTKTRERAYILADMADAFRRSLPGVPLEEVEVRDTYQPERGGGANNVTFDKIQ